MSPQCVSNISARMPSGSPRQLDDSAKLAWHGQLSTKLTTCRAMACPAASPVKLWSAPSTSMSRLLGTSEAHSSESCKGSRTVGLDAHIDAQWGDGPA